MTKDEQLTLLPRIPVGIKTQWRVIDNTFVALKAGPCPFYVFKTCLVYSHRPYNCRRFGCMRPDPKSEPFEATDSKLGCKNLEDRIKTSRVALRMAKLLQRKSMRWARAHGWKE